MCGKEILRKAASLADPSFAGADAWGGGESRVCGSDDASVALADGSRVSMVVARVMVPNFAHPGKEVFGSAAVVGWTSGFSTGDMVWGKVKSHPWWPGHILNEVFATAAVRGTKMEEGHVLVAFFGDNSYGWFDAADLIPFDQHFPEKSKQTTLRPFVKAVEDAVDEVSRRAALGLTCRCLDPRRFQPASVPGHFTIGVVGYGPGAVYSLEQMRNSREEFRPADMLSFAHRLAENPHHGFESNCSDTVDWIRSTAMLLAYRKLVFEEFDETYAQAFGVLPVRPSEHNAATTGRHPDIFAPRGTPQNDPLKKIQQSAAAAAKPDRKHAAPPSSSKNVKHEFIKRRDGAVPATLSLPPPSCRSDSSSSSSDHLKREAGADQLQESKLLPETMSVDLQASHQALDCSVWPLVATVASPASSGEKLTKRKLKDLPYGSAVNAMEDRMMKKRRKMKQPVFSLEQSADRRRPPMEGGELLQQPEFQVKEEEDGSVVTALELAPGSHDVKLAVVLADLLGLASDMFHCGEADAPLAVVRHVFLRFRSLVYAKCSVLPPASETEDSAPPLPPQHRVASAEEVEEPSRKLVAVAWPRPDDPTKSGWKRFRSERQEEDSEKRAMKLSKVLALAARNKAESAPERPSEGSMAAASAPAVISAMTEASKGQKAATTTEVKARVPRPTYIVMKFPPRTTLPSIPSLKVKLARFGPLDISGTRVYWKTFTCKVLFKFHTDALSALDHLQQSNDDLFGQIKVMYSIREVEPTPEPIPTPEFRPVGNGGRDSQPTPSQRQSSAAAPLKSILKKTGEDARVGNGNGGAKKGLRVTFRLPGEENYNPRAAATVDGNRSSRVMAPPPPSSESVTFRPSPPLPLPFIAPPARTIPLEEAWRPLGSGDGGVDISRDMVSLLVRCHHVVANLKAVLGYLPCHPL